MVCWDPGKASTRMRAPARRVGFFFFFSFGELKVMEEKRQAATMMYGEGTVNKTTLPSRHRRCPLLA